MRYTKTAMLFHWLTLLLLLINLPLGSYVEELAFSLEKLRLVNYHKWLGISIFLLVLLRLGWRLSHQPPLLPVSIPLWQEKIAQLVHGLLYLLLLLIPLSGWLMSSAKGVPVVYLGVLPLPDLLDKNKQLAELLGEVHEALCGGLMLLVALHVAAALKHHFIDRDKILYRMWPWGKL